MVKDLRQVDFECEGFADFKYVIAQNNKDLLAVVLNKNDKHILPMEEALVTYSQRHKCILTG